jgi:Uma2 family endonuclease
LNLPFYLAHGVQDGVVFDPAAQRITHYTHTEVVHVYAPQELQLRCGCWCTLA